MSLRPSIRPAIRQAVKPAAKPGESRNAPLSLQGETLTLNAQNLTIKDR